MTRLLLRLDSRAGPGPFGNTDPAGYVFHRHGRPLHPKYVLDHFHLLCDKAGIPRIALHDLRHLAMSFGLAAGVPLPIMSKTLRHQVLSTSANIYAELIPRAARAGADGIAWILDNADREESGAPICRPRLPRPPLRTPAPTAPPPRRPHRGLDRAARRPSCDHHLTRQQKEPAPGLPSTGSHHRHLCRDDRI
ncbi:hypothetical protein [Kitasatospora sp. NPDC090308]|uniref:hypothetical protein n=1 Tax=Kitasatospora sp. NPDC090308 TaxID=3364082 RepID=UPI00380683C6